VAAGWPAAFPFTLPLILVSSISLAIFASNFFAVFLRSGKPTRAAAMAH
jgi:hypothetical protein